LNETEKELQLEIVRDGKLFVNPLHLPVKEIRMSEEVETGRTYTRISSVVPHTLTTELCRERWLAYFLAVLPRGKKT
jgi:hypothetical protein